MGSPIVAEVRFLDYRDVPESGFDAVSSIGLTEHIGRRNLGAYFTRLTEKLRPGGRLLNHCITRPTTRERAQGRRLHRSVCVPRRRVARCRHDHDVVMQNHGLEPRHEENLREHYAMTLRDWGTNLETNWTESVAEVGLRRARVWELYMAASRVGFDLNKIQLHQILGVKLGKGGRSGFPLRPAY